MSKQAARKHSSAGVKTRRIKRSWIIVAALVLVALAGMHWLPLGRWSESLRTWIEHSGAFAPELFVAIYIVAGLLFVPHAALTIAAGAIFGLGWGALLASCASVAVVALAILIARHIARKPIERRVRAHPRFASIDCAISATGWKLVVLMRISPILPFGLTNYLLGVTRIGLVPCLVASWLGMLPGTLLYAYLGDIGIAGLSRSPKSPLQWTLFVAGLAAIFVFVLWSTRIARRSLERRCK